MLAFSLAIFAKVEQIPQNHILGRGQQLSLIATLSQQSCQPVAVEPTLQHADGHTSRPESQMLDLRHIHKMVTKLQEAHHLQAVRSNTHTQVSPSTVLLRWMLQGIAAYDSCPKILQHALSTCLYLPVE